MKYVIRFVKYIFSEITKNYKGNTHKKIDLNGVQITGKTFRWKGYYEKDMNEAKTIASKPAAAVIIRADLCKPVATASIFDRPASCSSLIRESRNSS